jgi:hypothetical protein
LPRTYGHFWNFCAFDEQTKACNLLIYRLLFVFDDMGCGDKGSRLEHLAGILNILKDFYKDKKK